jgi:hypothetical protein
VNVAPASCRLSRGRRYYRAPPTMEFVHLAIQFDGIGVQFPDAPQHNFSFLIPSRGTQCACQQIKHAGFEDRERYFMPVHAEGLPGFWISCAFSRVQATKCFQASLSGLKLGESAAFLLDQVILHTTYAFRSSENALPIRRAFAE